MKRFTKKMKKLSLISLGLDLIHIIIILLLAIHAFKILKVPDVVTDVLDINYKYLFLTVSSTQLNIIISLLIGILLVVCPIFVTNFKKIFDKDKTLVEEWDYRLQYLYSFIDLLTLNILSMVVRFILANDIENEVNNYGFTKSFKLTLIKISKIFKKETYVKLKKEKSEKKEKTKEQLDLEVISKKDLIKKVVLKLVTYCFLIVMALFIFIPFYWMILTALKTENELSTSISPRFFIKLSEMQWVNFKIALTRFDFSLYIKNTILVGTLTTLGTVTTTILAAFAFSRLEFKGRDFIFSLLLMTMMIPGELYTITNFITVSKLNWYDHFVALIVPFMASVFYIFFLRQTFRQIPDSLYKAAKVDGCGDFKYLTRIMIPIASPTILTITILSFIGSWDAYIWPQLATPSKEHWLISVALRSTNFTVGTGSDARPLYNLQLAATTLVTVPLLIIFFLLKKYIVRGVGRSGTKG